MRACGCAVTVAYAATRTVRARARVQVLCFELLARTQRKWTLHYVRGAVAVTDIPNNILELIKQRRRWLNGAFFSTVYYISNWERYVAIRAVQPMSTLSVRDPDAPAVCGAQNCNARKPFLVATACALRAAGLRYREPHSCVVRGAFVGALRSCAHTSQIRLACADSVPVSVHDHDIQHELPADRFTAWSHRQLFGAFIVSSATPPWAAPVRHRTLYTAVPYVIPCYHDSANRFGARQQGEGHGTRVQSVRVHFRLCYGACGSAARATHYSGIGLRRFANAMQRSTYQLHCRSMRRSPHSCPCTLLCRRLPPWALTSSARCSTVKGGSSL